MDTTKIKGVTFQHNGDYFGDVLISIKGKETTIPFEVLRDFVAEYVRINKITKLENMDADTLLLGCKEN